MLTNNFTNIEVIIIIIKLKDYNILMCESIKYIIFLLNFRKKLLTNKYRK